MQNREICEGSQKAKSFLFETAFTSNSAAMAPISVVQIGVKGAGCENKIPQELPNH